jgi:hypothetical protein
MRDAHSLLINFLDKIGIFSRILPYSFLPEDFIRSISNQVNWSVLPRNRTLSKDFIREFQSELDWFFVSKYQVLDEDFIREFKDRVDWVQITTYQTLSEKFILEHLMYFNTNCIKSIIKHQKISSGLIFNIKKRGYEDLINEDIINRFVAAGINSEAQVKDLKKAFSFCAENLAKTNDYYSNIEV